MVVEKRHQRYRVVAAMESATRPRRESSLLPRPAASAMANDAAATADCIRRSRGVAAYRGREGGAEGTRITAPACAAPARERRSRPGPAIPGRRGTDPR